ncbi:uncharacterized protein LOC143211590 isoform X4 [Lasioglossum baleicum]|uniref:uncharacterized protein LOC143211590 isoform X4 n=1 Tax=Lasioglossum baleicum TaxID=434251 RepID=UPI003FCC4560
MEQPHFPRSLGCTLPGGGARKSVLEQKPSSMEGFHSDPNVARRINDSSRLELSNPRYYAADGIEL